MKILHVISSLQTGGAEKLMVDLLPRLRNKGIECELLTFDGSRTTFREDLEKAGVTVHDFGQGGSPYSIWNLIKLLPFLRKYDIVHTHTTPCQLFAAIGSALCRTILCTTEHSTSNRRRGWKWYAPVDRWMYSRYKAVISISQKAEDNLRQFIGNSKTRIVTVQNGIDVALYSTAKPSSELELIAPESIKIIMIASFRLAKDQDTIIKALTYLPSQFHLFLVGDGIRRTELEELVNTKKLADRVHFLGVRSDVPNLLHAVDYVVMSSHYEGLSLSSVEGMSSGRPFLASDVDGLREVVQGAGIIFPHEDSKALANEILFLNNHPENYAITAASCHERALQYDISKMADDYAQIYSSL